MTGNLRPTCLFLSFTLTPQANLPQSLIQKAGKDRHEHLPRSNDHGIAGDWKDDECTFVCAAGGVYAH